MLAIERREDIMNLIRAEKSVRVNELALKYHVTEETIRRDLDKLDKEGKVKKTYGGAVLEKPVSEDPSFSDRLKVNMVEKKTIGAKGAELIEDGETIFIDMSTTSLEVIKAVPSTVSITVITNSLEAILVLSQRSNIRLVTIGGTFDKANQFMGGAMANKFIDHYYVDKTFFSVKGLSEIKGLTDSNEEIAEIKSRMVNNAKEAILVVDSSKFGHTALVSNIQLKNINRIVTECQVVERWQKIFDKQGIEVIIAN